MLKHNATISCIYGNIQAQAAIDDGPIFDNQHIENASFESRISFAKALVKGASKQEKPVNVDIGKYTKDEGDLLAEVKATAQRAVNLGRNAEGVLPKKVYERIDKKMTQWADVYKKQFAPKLKAIDAKYNKLADGVKNKEQLKAIELKRQKEQAPIVNDAKASYRASVAKQFTKANEQLQSVFNDYADNPKKLNAQLKMMGMAQKDAYYVNQYLKYLSNGGPFFEFNPGGGSKASELITNTKGNITGNKIAWNANTALWNVTEFVQKAPSVFGFKNTANGIVDAQKAAVKAGLTIFDKLPELEKAGIYDNDFSPLRPEGKFDPVARSQNMLDNLAYFTGKRAGNSQKAMTQVAYRPKPWNDTIIYQDPRAKSDLNFMSFQLRHMQQYGGWVRDAFGLNKNISVKQQKEAVKALATYSAVTGVLFGAKSVIPAPLYVVAKTVDPGLDDQIESLNNALNLGAVGEKGLVGAATGLNLSTKAQPFGGVALGIGADMVNGAIDVGKKAPKIAKEIGEGRLDKAAVLGAMAIVNLTQIFKNGANATQQKIIDGAGKAYVDDEFDTDGLYEHILQSFFGKQAVKKAS